jgi:hypothetical protein
MQNAREIGARHSPDANREANSLAYASHFAKEQNFANASPLRTTFSFFASLRYNQNSEWDRKTLQWSQNTMSTPFA